MLIPVLEKSLIQDGYTVVVGIDEAGRGAWAGPVAVGYYAYTVGIEEFKGINDSKKLSPKSRAEKYQDLLLHGGVIYQEAERIDKLGIGVAITDAIFEIIYKFTQSYGRANVFFLIDGHFAVEFPAKYSFITKGDSKHYSIAAASILAKHGRDSLMLDMHERYPDYSFDKHKGYGTALHKKALEILGPLKQIHRYSFSPIQFM